MIVTSILGRRRQPGEPPARPGGAIFRPARPAGKRPGQAAGTAPDPVSRERAIMDLCALAGQPGAARIYIEAGFAPAQVQEHLAAEARRAQLLDPRAIYERRKTMTQPHL